MAAGDTNITIIGNLVDDPELRFTPSGAAVAKFRDSVHHHCPDCMVHVDRARPQEDSIRSRIRL